MIPDEILTDHPDRFRAMLVESSNPAHSLADSSGCAKRWRRSSSWSCIDVAMTETARLADYVLPAASQFEKPEATFFNLEFPHNTFHLRQPLLEPLEGTLPEPEIYARLIRELGVVDQEVLDRLSAAAQKAPRPTQRLLGAPPPRTPDSPRCAVRPLRDARPHPARGSRRSRRPVGALAARAPMTYPAPMQRAGHADGDALFDADDRRARRASSSPATTTRTTGPTSPHPDKRIALEIPEMLAELAALLAQASRD